jgi:hypothetical protein
MHVKTHTQQVRIDCEISPSRRRPYFEFTMTELSIPGDRYDVIRFERY